MLNYDAIKSYRFDEVVHPYDAGFTMLYALSLGIGSEFTNDAHLRFVNDAMGDQFVAMPTMATVLGFPGTWWAEPGLGIEHSGVVHGEELIDLHTPIPASGTLVARHEVTHVVDKGEGRGAIVVTDKHLINAETEVPVATVRHALFCRKDGGFSALDDRADTLPEITSPFPGVYPDKVWRYQTLPQQALMFRLCTDRHPVHASPDVAKQWGFDEPIMHGQCTLGIACFAILAEWADYEPSRLRRLSVRLSAPLYPGETISLEMVEDGSLIAFRVRAVERDVVVLDRGTAELKCC